MRTVRFRFKDAMNKSFTISLDEPKDNLTFGDISTFTGYVTQNDIFRPFGNKVTEFLGAELVTVTRTNIE